MVPKPLKPKPFTQIFPTVTRFKVPNSLTKSPEPPFVSLAIQRFGPLFSLYPTPEVIIMGVLHPSRKGSNCR